MASNPLETSGDNFTEILDEASIINCDLANAGEVMVSSSKITILQKEKLQLQQEVNQLWQYLAESKGQQTLMQSELERKTEKSNALLLISRQSTEYLKNIRLHQNTLVDFIAGLEANRDEVTSSLATIKAEYERTFQQLSEKLQKYQREENNREAEILKLRETIRQQDEKLVDTMEIHCKDQELLNDAKREIEALKADSARAELETLRKRCEQRQDAWNNERNKLMLAIENMREKFSADLINEKDNAATISKLRHQETLQFQRNLKAQLEKNTKLETEIKSLENALSAQKETIKTSAVKTPVSGKSKRKLTPSPCSDVETSDLSMNQSLIEPIFKRKRFGFFESTNEPRHTVIRDQYFCRPASSIPVDSTSGPTDVGLKRDAPAKPPEYFDCRPIDCVIVVTTRNR